MLDKFHQSEDYFFRSISINAMDFGDVATAYLTKIEAPYFNLVYIRKKSSLIEKILKSCKAFYEKERYPWGVVVPSSVDLHTEKLKHLGLCESEKAIAMVIDLKSYETLSFNASIEIKQVDSRLREWIFPLIEAFESSPEIANQYKDAHERALLSKADFQHFTAYADGAPVSSLTLSIQSGCARIDDVGTLPSFQRKGFAIQLVHHVLEKAKRLDCQYCFLEASDSGLFLYKKTGFMPLFNTTTFVRDLSNNEVQ